MPPFNDDINQHDLSEAPRLEKDPDSRGTVIAITLGVLAVIALLIFGSLPDLSPEEIISMEGYAGEQPTRHIFNLQSLEESKTAITDKPQSDINTAAAPVVTENSQTFSQTDNQTVITGRDVNTEQDVVTEQVVAEPSNDISELPLAVVLPMEEPVVEAPVAEPEVVAPVVEESAPVVQSAVVDVVDPVLDAGVEVAVVEAPVVVEVVAPEADPVAGVKVPVADATIVDVPLAETTRVEIATVTAAENSERISIFAEIPEERVVASMASTPKLDEQPDTVVVSTAVIDDFSPMPIGRDASSNASEGARLLPLRSILNDATELKESPDENSTTLVMLGEGVIVSAFERRGEWIFVGTNDGSSLTGYVKESGLKEVK